MGITGLSAVGKLAKRLSAMIISEYTSFDIQLRGGGKVSVNVRKDLLRRPLSGETACILHLNGAKVYVPQNRDITIGKAKDCDIRIDDPKIEQKHLIINAGDTSMLAIFTLDEGAKVGMVDSVTRQKTYLGIDPVIVENDCHIRFGLSKGKAMSVKLEIIRPETAMALDELLEGLVARPPVKEIVDVESAAGGVERQESVASDPKRESIFSTTMSAKEGIELYFSERVRLGELNEVCQRYVNMSGGSGCLGVVLATALLSALGGFIITGELLLPSGWFWAGFASLIPVFTFSWWAYAEAEKLPKENLRDLDRKFTDYLRRAEVADVAKAISSMPTSKERKRVLSIFNIVNDERKNLMEMGRPETSPRARIEASAPAKKPEIGAQAEDAQAIEEAAIAEAAEAEAEEKERKA